ncbi:hypothetical protein TrVE_jg6031 [Triparma verrucosa]|nr:hypothetical protein TrVE_jg6031 [Triparma verrucosa]
MRDNNISFLCLTTGGTLVVPLRVVYGFLEALHKTFSTKFNVSKMETATTAYCLRSAFSADLESAIHRWNTNPPSQQSEGTQALMRKIEKAKDAVSLNISELLERGEKVELLLDASIALEEEAQVFKKSGNTLENALYQKNMKMTAIAAAVVVVVIFTMRANFHGENY